MLRIALTILVVDSVALCAFPAAAQVYYYPAVGAPYCPPGAVCGQVGAVVSSCPDCGVVRPGTAVRARTVVRPRRAVYVRHGLFRTSYTYWCY